MNSAGKRRVSRAVRQAVSGHRGKERNDRNKLMAFLQEAKLENLSDHNRETASRQVGMQTEDAWNIDRDETARRAKGGKSTNTRKATSTASTSACKSREWPGTPVGLDMLGLCTPGVHPRRFHLIFPNSVEEFIMALCYGMSALRRQHFHVVEETTTSIFVRCCSCLGELLFPAINVIDCVTVSEFDNFWSSCVCDSLRCIETVVRTRPRIPLKLPDSLSLTTWRLCANGCSWIVLRSIPLVKVRFLDNGSLVLGRVPRARRPVAVTPQQRALAKLRVTLW